jgi:glycosyltransferase involved in cell wall biosynthesis
MPGIARDKEFIFVGRLVSDKGVDLLLEAMALLLRENIEPRLTIIGSGPDEKGLKAQAEKLGLHKVYFLGARTGVELANLLNQHKVLVVPSRWEEPFGIVALEGIACGCFVIGSAGGGLVDAIGSCGKTFRNGDVKELASLLKAVVCESTCCELPEEAREAHLQRHSRGSIAREYLQLFSEALDRR